MRTLQLNSFKLSRFLKINKMIYLFIILVFLHSILHAGANENKPSIWIFTDLTDPRDQREGGHPQTDPDDICSMASLFLSANRFNIKNIVISANQQKNLKNPMPFFREVLLAAYYHDLPYLNKNIGGYPEHIPVEQSICTRSGKVIQFDESNSYADLTKLETVKKLIEDAGREKVFVLSWGSLSEPAMAVKHCIETGNAKALQNMVFISHWTKSMVVQGTEEKPFEVTNCQADRNACAYLHRVAFENPLVTFIEIGGAGQTGMIGGITKFPYREEFEKSRLGQIFLRSKFYNGKPDQSDASTFWLVRGEFGVTMNDYPQDGSLSLEQEKQMIEKFCSGADKIVLDLLHRSNMAAKAENPFGKDFQSRYFTYVYKKKYYGAYLPYDGVLTIYNQKNNQVQKHTLKAGNHELDFTDLPKREYKVFVEIEGIERYFKLTKE
jgi:hypothetical protein